MAPHVVVLGSAEEQEAVGPSVEQASKQAIQEESIDEKGKDSLKVLEEKKESNMS